MVCYVKQAGHKNTNTVQLHLNEVPRIIKFIDSWENGDCQRLGGRENSGGCLMHTGFQFCRMIMDLEIDCITVGMYVILMNHTFKNG